MYLHYKDIHVLKAVEYTFILSTVISFVFYVFVVEVSCVR